MVKSLRPVGIAGTGSCVPDIVVTNAELAAVLPTSDQWIRSHTGIVERRFAPSDVQTSDLATAAARAALQMAEIEPADVDAIVIAIGTGDFLSPPTADLVQNKLGCRNAFCVDVRQACAAFVTSTIMASKFVADGSADTVLVIGAELSSRTKVKRDDRTMGVIFGDGAGAVVLRPAVSGSGILATYLRSDGTGWDAVGIYGGGSVSPLTPERVAAGEHCMKMDGHRVWDFVCEAFPDAVRQVLERAGLSLADVDVVVPHQANLLGIEAGMDALGLPRDRAFTNLQKYGNTIEASVPIALDEAVRTGRIRSGHLVVLAAFGAGWNWSSIAVRWS
ncbi:MAG: beta-ketoacyl-ACP synthase 3 [Deltaproteobacteria bacterium]|nr:beta-ketoacyl-ACP synthase 3 [Deltaproteobacteria bacterium]